MTADIAALVAKMTTHAKGLLAEDPDGFLPVAFIVCPGGQLTVVGLGWTTTREKWLMYQLLRAEAEAREAVAVFTICDSWVSHCGKDDPPLLPRRDPDRQEALVVMVHEGTRATAMTYPYRREAGGVVWDEPLPLPEGVEDFNWDGGNPPEVL